MFGQRIRCIVSSMTEYKTLSTQGMRTLTSHCRKLVIKTPAKDFLEITKTVYVQGLQQPSDFGIDPEKALLFAYSSRSLCRSPRDSGRRPSSSFAVSRRCRSFFISPTEGGSSPLSSLAERSSVRHASQRPTEPGSCPAICFAGSSNRRMRPPSAPTPRSAYFEGSSIRPCHECTRSATSV